MSKTLRDERLLELASSLTVMFGFGPWTIAMLDYLGGRIDVASEVGAGSIFTLMPPVAGGAGDGKEETQ